MWELRPFKIKIMDNFLTYLYFELFRANAEYERLRGITNFPDEDCSISRNDQAQTEQYRHCQKLREIITTYLKEKYDEK